MSKKELDSMFIKEAQEVPVEYFIDSKIDHYEFFKNRVLQHLLEVNYYQSHVDFCSEKIKIYENSSNRTEEENIDYSVLFENNSMLEECSDSLERLSKMYMDLYIKYDKVSEKYNMTQYREAVL